MKKTLFLAVTGLAVSLGLGLAACQSSDTSGNGGDSTGPGPTGAGGDSSGGTTGSPGAGGNGTPGAGGTGTPGAGGTGTPGAGGTGTPGAGGTGTPGAGGNGTPGAGGNGTPGAGGNGTPGAGGNPGAGGDAAGGSGQAGDTGAGGDSGGSAGAKDCKEIKLHPGKAGMPSLFCPFSMDAMGKTQYCMAPDEHCCEGAKTGDVSSCNPVATMCPAGDADWACFDKDTDCAQGSVCCVVGQNPVTNTVDSMCSDMFPNNHFLGGKVTGTKCAASCDLTKELEVCESDAQCTAPMHCLPTTSKGAQFGVCGM